MSNTFTQGGIYLPFAVFGGNRKQALSLVGLVDTGFNGYLTLSAEQATPLNLQIKGSQEYLLANGSSSRHLICWGTIECLGQKLTIPIDVQEHGPILLGMQLFGKLKQTLTIDFSQETFEFTQSSLVKRLKFSRKPKLKK
jgi:predicted aspartyl protease